jgi:hypothetical protein
MSKDEVGDVGRVVISKKNFIKIGGYDENMKFISFEDTDILIRGISLGLKYRHKYDHCDITNISNPELTETKEYKDKWWYHFNKNKEISYNNIKARNFVANKQGFNEKLENYKLYTPSKTKEYYIHFIFFGYTEFEYIHYIAILSAIKYNPNAKVNLFYYKESNNKYWNEIKGLCNMIYTIPPDYANNKEITHYQYKADFLRLEILYNYGGVYLDIDVITLKSYENLINYSCCLSGEKYIDDIIKFSNNPENFASVTNAIIICKKKDPFIKEWLDQTSKQYMNNNIWAWHAVILPLELIKTNSFNVHIEPVESFIPFDFRCHDILNNNNNNLDISRSYCFHLWETIWDSYLKKYKENVCHGSILDNIISEILTIK